VFILTREDIHHIYYDFQLGVCVYVFKKPTVHKGYMKKELTQKMTFAEFTKKAQNFITL
jgi:hypothetical protein